MPSKDEFCQKWFHEIFGMVCDALTSNDKKGGELSMWMERRRLRLLEITRLMWDDVQPPNRPAPEPKPAGPILKPPGTK